MAAPTIRTDKSIAITIFRIHYLPSGLCKLRCAAFLRGGPEGPAMTRQYFRQLVAETLDSLPDEFRERLENVVVMVEDAHQSHHRPRTPAPRSSRPERQLLLGVFHGVPATQQSVFALPSGPARIV